MDKIILLIGAPGAGKGTQAKILQDRENLPQISTGDIFRALSKSDTPLARQVREVLASGKLVSDELVIQVVEDRTSLDDCKNGYILDGFPRTLAQAEKLEDLAKAQGKSLEAILVDVPFDILEKRITGRRSHAVTGEIYNIFFKIPPRDVAESDLIQRADDTEEKVKVRLETYQRETSPLIEYYEKTGRLKKVDGTGEPEQIYREIEKIVLAK